MRTMLDQEKKRNRIWFTAVISVVALLIAGEAGSRWLDQREALQKYKDKLTVIEHFREQPYSVSKPAGTKRVLLLGGSAVYDTVDKWEDTWPHALERELSEKYKMPIEVINMGFYSESSVDELYKLYHDGVRFDPDLIIVFDGNNDVHNLWMHASYWKRLHEEKSKPILGPKKKHHFLTEFRGAIKRESALYRRVNRISKWIQRQVSLFAMKHQSQKAEDGQMKDYDEPSETIEEAQPKEINDTQNTDVSPSGGFEPRSKWPEIFELHNEIYENNLTKMAKIAKKNGSDIVFIFQPDLSYRKQVTGRESEAERLQYLSVVQKNDGDWQEVIKKTYPRAIQILEKISQDYQVPYYDFHDIFRENPDKDYSDYFQGNVHFTDKGRGLIVERILSIIEKEGFLK